MILSKQNVPRWLVKLFNYEYWTWWVFFLPVVPYWAFLALRNRSLTYFTTVNPCIPDGGVFGESKMDILNQIDPKYLPTALFVPLNEDFEAVLEKLKNSQIKFPIVAKPDVGGRGFRVKRVDSEQELRVYLTEAIMPVILQEFVDYELELGVMYARLPNQPKGRVTSITQKEFLTITGNGHATVGELLQQNTRARMAMDELRERIKWNAPSFGYEGNDRVTFPIQPGDRFEVVLHRGVHKRNDPFTFDDSDRLITWATNDRGVTVVASPLTPDDETQLVTLLRRWLQATR